MMMLWVFSYLFVQLSNGEIVDESCTAFQTNGEASSIFQYYRFYDFRQQSALNAVVPAESNIESHPRFKCVSDSTWIQDWYLRDFPRISEEGPKITVNFKTDRIKITESKDISKDYTSYLTLSTARLEENSQEGGEITYQEFDISYASARVFARVSGDTGAVASLFTYYDDETESDIEILTRSEPTEVLYSNQPAFNGDEATPGASELVTLPNGRVWTDWHVHRLDWTPSKSVFFIDDVPVYNTAVNIPKVEPASRIYLDMWGANSSTSGSMPIGGQATFEIQWIELLFNQSVSATPANSSSLHKLCTIGEMSGSALHTSTASIAATSPANTVSPTKRSDSTRVAPCFDLGWLWGRL